MITFRESTTCVKYVFLKMIVKQTAFLLSTPHEGVASKMLERGAWMQRYFL